MLSFWLAVTLSAVFFSCSACSDDAHHHSDPDGGDTDTDTDTDTDSDTDGDSDSDWCPELPTSCGAPTALESCGDDTLGAPRLIAPLSGKYVRDRRPEIIWDGAAAGVSQYRVEIARDRAFTDVVYRSTTYEPYPDIDNRFRHIVSCDLDCGVHFFRVMSVTSPECEVGTSIYTWEMYVGMAPYDLDRDGVPDIMCWHVEPASGEFENDKIQGYAIFDLDEKGGQTLTQDDLAKVVEFEVDEPVASVWAGGCGDVNGDDFYDIGVSINRGEGLDLSFEYFFFSNIQKSVIQTAGDAFFHISSVDGNDNITAIYYLGWSYSFPDVNGDGFSDIVFLSSDYHKLYFVFGTSEEINEEVPNADVTFLSPAGWASTGYLLMDINGDGFGDLVAGAKPESDAGAWSSIIFQFGAADLPSEITLMMDSPVISPPDTDAYVDAWNIGRDFSFSGILGDVDFDGFPETTIRSSAINTDVTAEISTNGFSILSEYNNPSFTTYPETLFSTIVGDFVIGDTQEETECLSYISPSGDLNDDGIADFVIGSSIPDEFGEDSIFNFFGKSDWNSVYLSSEAESVETSGFLRYLADIDGDGFVEQFDNRIVLSSGPVISFSAELLNYCPIIGRLVLPTQQM